MRLIFSKPKGKIKSTKNKFFSFQWVHEQTSVGKKKYYQLSIFNYFCMV